MEASVRQRRQSSSSNKETRQYPSQRRRPGERANVQSGLRGADAAAGMHAGLRGIDAAVVVQKRLADDDDQVSAQACAWAEGGTDAAAVACVGLGRADAAAVVQKDYKKPRLAQRGALAVILFLSEVGT